MNKYPLPQWLQGNDHWTLKSLSFWLKLPNWSAQQAAALLLGVDPERDTPDCLAMIDGITIEASETEPRCKSFLTKIRSAQKRFSIAADAHGIGNATPIEWIDFAKQTVGLSPEWLTLATDNLLIQGISTTPTVTRLGDITLDEETSLAGAPACETDNPKEGWIEAVIRIANEIASTRWRRGEREITARNIANAVAMVLNKNSAHHGIRGPRSEGGIRSVALKGWKFVPPK